MFTSFLTEDRFYNYAVKLAAVTFKRSIAAGSIFGGIDSHAWRSKATREQVSGFLANFLYSRGVYRSGQQQFLNANFVWNQDEVSQNSRYAKRDFTILDSLALRQCNTSMIPDTHLLKLLFPTRYTPRSIHQDFYQAFYFREIYIVPVNSNFPVPKGHNANFAWKQDETSVKFVRS